MRKEIVANAGMAYLAEISLIIFVTVFLIFAIRTLFFMTKSTAAEIASLPLDDGTDPCRTTSVSHGG